MSKSLFTAIACCLLAACSSSTEGLPTVTPPPIPENAKTRCTELHPLGEPATMADLHRFAMDTVDAFNECAARLDALVDILKGRGL